MPQVVKLGIKRPVTRPLLPDPDPRPVKYTFISVDDHLMEPPHAFEGRMPRRFADRAPRVVETEEGHQICKVRHVGDHMPTRCKNDCREGNCRCHPEDGCKVIR